jgi:hypothetical protein
MDPVGQIFGETTDVPVDAPPTGSPQGLVEEDVSGKYLLVGVPEFDGQGLGSYLRLGAASAAAVSAAAAVATATSKGLPIPLPDPSSTGEDLAQLVQGFTDDGRARTGAFEQTLMNMSGTNAFAESGPVAQADRVNESAKLHTKGGWRDHTDGNRVVTTRGDKVEVIRGNYKLIVLGRQETAGIGSDEAARRNLIASSAGVDMSGGLVDSAPGDLNYPDMGGAALDVVYAWAQNGNGAWTQTTTVGSAMPNPDDANTRVISKSYFDSQTIQVGSVATPVNLVEQTTFAHDMSTSVHATLNTAATVGEVVETTTEVDSRNDFELALLDTEMRAVGAYVEGDAGVCLATIQIADLIPSLYVGPVIDNHLGVHIDLHAGVHSDFRAGVHGDIHFILHECLHLLWHADLHLGIHTETHLGPHVQMDNAATDMHELTLDGTMGRLRNLVAQEVALDTSVTTIAAGHVHVSPLHIKS